MTKTCVIFNLLLLNFIYSSAQNISFNLPGLKTDREKADTLYALSLKQYFKNRMDSAVILLHTGLPYAQKTNEPALIANYYVLEGNALMLIDESRKGIDCLSGAAPWLQKTDQYDVHRKYLMLNGMMYERLYMNDSAMYYFRLCEELNNRKDPYENWQVFVQYAKMMQYAEAYENAEKYYKQAYTLVRSKDIRFSYGIVLNDLISLYYMWGKPELFATTVSEFKKFFESGKKDFSHDAVHSMLFINWNKKTADENIRFMEEVRKEMVREGRNMNLTLVNRYLADFYDSAGQYGKALQYIRENQDIYRKENNIIDLYANTKIAYQLLKKSGDTRASLAEADVLLSQKDSMIQVQQRRQLLELEKKYETDKKDKDLALLNSQNQLVALQLNEEENRRKALLRENRMIDSAMEREKEYNMMLDKENNWRKDQLDNQLALKAAVTRENNLKETQLIKEKSIRRLLLAGTALFLVSGILIFALYRKQKLKNRLIQKQAENLQVLMKEIHHRVKNNLQVISSLLDLQSMTIGDEQASEAIKESRNRVYSMALIHQNLYREENLMSIEMKEYINKLSESLFQSYHAGAKKISLETDIDPVEMDVDMVIPIGLVINELVSNALKYAFIGKEGGILEIGLKKQENELLLKVKDNGNGFPSGMNIYKTQSFGYKLIKAFAQKLKARIEVYNDNGACVVLHIRKIS